MAPLPPHCTWQLHPYILLPGTVPSLPPASQFALCLQVHCTVSHFSLIHVACHQAARRADAALRHPKREWEGATLRNGETLCNNLVPVRGGSVSDAAYASAVATYWENLQVGLHFTCC